MTTTTPSIQDRIVALDWAAMTRDLDSFGCTIVRSVLTREECRSIAAMYERVDIFRSTIVMARHGFGRGEYKYWSYPYRVNLRHGVSRLRSGHRYTMGIIFHDAK